MITCASTSVGAGVFFLVCGLWNHDWRVILASFILMAIGPLLAFESRDERARRRHRARLDRLWDDDDLKDSA